MSTECLMSSLNRVDYFTPLGTRQRDRLAVNHSSHIFYSLSHDLSHARVPLSTLARLVFTSVVYWKIIYWRVCVFLINITKYALDRCINESCHEKARLSNPFTVTISGKRTLRIRHYMHIQQLSNGVSKCYGKGVFINSLLGHVYHDHISWRKVLAPAEPSDSMKD